jgi:integrase
MFPGGKMGAWRWAAVRVARPTLPLGTYGAIRTYQQGDVWRARTLYRDFDGVTRHVEKQAKTQGAARNALTAALRDRARIDRAGTITSGTRLSIVAEQWYSQLDGKSPSTMQAYPDRLDNQIIPALGAVLVRELSVSLIDRHLATVKRVNGPSVAKMTKSVLSGVCGLATRHDALSTNPCRDVASISTKPKREPRALSIEEVQRIRVWFAGDAKALERDLPDLVAFMVATGLRIGEACAVCWTDVDLDEATVIVRGTILRLRGQGLVLKPSPKSKAGDRMLELPQWCVELLTRRSEDPNLSERPKTNGAIGIHQPVFPAPVSGGWRDPSNTRRGLREAFAEMGMPGITSHAFRKTVATMMDDAGLSARQAADQLGHAKPSLTQDVYFGRKRRATGAATVLEVFGLTDAPAPVDAVR